MHEFGATIPNECKVAMNCTFVSDNLTGVFQVPSYYAWLDEGGSAPAVRVLPAHAAAAAVAQSAPPLAAQVALAHREPADAVQGLSRCAHRLHAPRSHQDAGLGDQSARHASTGYAATSAFEAAAFERLVFQPESIAVSIDLVIDQIERGAIPHAQIHDFQFADLMRSPLDALAALYRELRLDFPPEARAAVASHLEHKPRGKFGQNVYEVGERERIVRERTLFERYQRFHGVPDEV
jgi:hypothetical protein